jgi:tetratricopeptide (TPR) repeat protein
MQVSALNKLSLAVMWLGRLEETEQYLLLAERLARQYEDQAGLAEMFTVRCGVCNMIGDFPGVARYMGESIALGRELGIKEQMAYGLTHMANALTNMTRFDEARATAREALQLVEEIGHLQFKAELHMHGIPFHHLLDGNLDAARRAAEEGLAIARRIGLTYGESLASYSLGVIAHLRGEYERAIASYEGALRAAQAGPLPHLAVFPMGGLGSAYLDISPTLSEQIDHYHDQALSLLDTPMGMPAGGLAWADLGFCLLAKGKVDRADELFQKGLSTPAQQGLINRPRFLVGLVYVALARAHFDEAERQVIEARRYVEERAMQHLVPEVALAEGRVRAARSELDRALEQFKQAEAAALEMAMRPLVWQARAGAAKVLDALGRAAEAEAQRHEARAMIDEIAALFTDENLRAAFVESATRKLI